MPSPSGASGEASFRTFLTVLAALSAFAANSLLCREALGSAAIDPASFTTLRLASGALLLRLLARTRRSARASLRRSEGGWTSAIVLLVYAATFSVAYVDLPAGPGALLLFGAVQLTMLGGAVFEGERVGVRAAGGVVVAIGGLVALLLPGSSAPAFSRSSLMILSGIAWGWYSLRGRRVADPLRATASHFARAAPLSLALSLVSLSSAWNTPRGIVLAVVSGAVTSGCGYVLWHAAVRRLSATRAAAIQLMVPVLAGVGAVVALAEPMSARLLVSGALVLSGVFVVLSSRSRSLPQVPKLECRIPEQGRCSGAREGGPTVANAV
jgi:drug/metabolite transporter (DMT)-like permease